MPSAGPRPVAVELNAVLVALIDDEPQVLTLEGGGLLPSGPFETDHPTLQTGVRAWVERQTHHPPPRGESTKKRRGAERRGGSVRR